MSASAVSLSTSFRPTDTTTPAFTWGRYARAGLLTIGVSVLANPVFGTVTRRLCRTRVCVERSI